MTSSHTSFLSVANITMAATPLLAVVLTAFQYLAH
jgi:hypothetical protein